MIRGSFEPVSSGTRVVITFRPSRVQLVLMGVFLWLFGYFIRLGFLYARQLGDWRTFAAQTTSFVVLYWVFFVAYYNYDVSKARKLLNRILDAQVTVDL